MTIAQSIQADQEAVRMQRLKEHLANNYVDGIARTHRNAIIADQLRTAARNIAAVLEDLSLADADENTQDYANAVHFLSRRHERRTNQAAELAAALERETGLPF